MKLRFYSRRAFRITCLVTILLCALAILCGLMAQYSDAPLHYYLTARQLVHRIPVTFFSGIFAIVLCNLIGFLQKRYEP